MTSKKGLAFLALAALLLPAALLHAFPLKGSGAKVIVSEKPGYRILFSVSKQKEVRDDGKKWRELHWKLSFKKIENRDLFGSLGWVEVQFQDDKGFVLTGAQVSYELNRQEYYGMVWIQEKKVRHLEQADIKPLQVPPVFEKKEEEKPAEAPIEETAPEEAQKKSEEKPVEAAPLKAEEKPKAQEPAPKTPAAPEPKKEEAKAKPEKTLTAAPAAPVPAETKKDTPAAPAAPAATPVKEALAAPSVPETPEAVTRGGDDNGKMEQVLAAANQQPETHVEPSPEEIKDPVMAPKEIKN